ncbi:glucose 1-dehydrogenase [Pontibacillus yanchengensis]|uniref:Glucose 1-dehydrogenase n=2 Tax=Pontibacillus yanchengensis TaxID=462910 RepID=A0ACC7VA79_9BACI|nr:glucose 1-dehydrogenase [Pontibacillus yanchengensis]MYL32806.1 glucose 1-dehydrogenase [Pontibacillus yanchengensis]MYL51716.1 glucose 1-dehydrogenase [Pontibacillus yanchengensis]
MYLPSFSLHNKLAAITGATKGIGYAITMAYAEAGADVIVISRTEDDVHKVVKEVEQYGQKGYPIVADVKDYKSIISQIESTLPGDETIDVWVNNAGMNIRSNAFEVTDEEWDQIIQTNMKSAFFLSQYAARQMKEKQEGKIINISSVAGHVALRTGVVYGMTKSALIQMTKTLALEWGEYNIHVNAIGPWYFPTALTEKLLENEEYVDEIKSRTPLRRVGELKELAGSAVFLASDASNYMTGQTLFVDGGMTIYGF